MLSATDLLLGALDRRLTYFFTCRCQEKFSRGMAWLRKTRAFAGPLGSVGIVRGDVGSGRIDAYFNCNTLHYGHAFCREFNHKNVVLFCPVLLDPLAGFELFTRTYISVLSIG